MLIYKYIYYKFNKIILIINAKKKYEIQFKSNSLTKKKTVLIAFTLLNL